MAGMGETCNHVVAVICKQQFAPVQQIPHAPVLQMNGSHAEEILNLEELKSQTLLEEILHSVIKRKTTCSQSKKKFNLLTKSDKKQLSLIDFASAHEEIVPNSIPFTAVRRASASGCI